MSFKKCKATIDGGLRCNSKCKDGQLCNKHKSKVHKKENHCKGLNCNMNYSEYHTQIITLRKCGKTCSGEYCDAHEYKYRLEKPDECPMCDNEISENNEIPLECGHWVHKKCLKLTNNHKCPVCCCPMKRNEIEYIFGLNSIPKNIQDLKPINFENFKENTGLLFVIYSDKYSYLSVNKHSYIISEITSENINPDSFLQIIDRDLTRYMCFRDTIISTAVKKLMRELIPSMAVTSHIYDISIEVGKIINNNTVLVNNMKHLFNIANYNIDVHNSSFRVLQFEEEVKRIIQYEDVIQDYIRNEQNQN